MTETIYSSSEFLGASFVKMAEMNDKRTAELLRRALHDLLHKQGWCFEELTLSFNANREKHNLKHVHPNNIRNALNGRKNLRKLACDLELFISSRRGSILDDEDFMNALNNFSLA
jgi:hypothetical protein